LGFVSNFLKKIYEPNSSQGQFFYETLGDNYTLNIQTELQKTLDVTGFLNKNVDSSSFFVYANSQTPRHNYNSHYPIDIQVKLADTSGIIYATTKLANINAHVDKLKSSLQLAPFSSLPFLQLI